MDLVEKLNRVEAREAELRDMLEQIVKILRDPDKSFLSMWEAVWKIIGPTLSLSRPGHEVLSREHIEAAAERESRIEEFLQLLASEGEAKFLEVREIVEDIAARDNISADVKQEAVSGSVEQERSCR